MTLIDANWRYPVSQKGSISSRLSCSPALPTQYMINQYVWIFPFFPFKIKNFIRGLVGHLPQGQGAAVCSLRKHVSYSCKIYQVCLCIPNQNPFTRNTPSTAGNSMTSSERPSPEPLLKKEASPAVLGGENSGNALEASNAFNCRVWGIPAVLSREISGNALRAFPGSFWNFSGISSGKSQPYCPKDPAVLKILWDSELLHRSVSTTPPIFTTLCAPLWREKCLQNQGKRCQRRGVGVAVANHCAIVNLLCLVNLLRRSLFSTAGSFGWGHGPFHGRPCLSCCSQRLRRLATASFGLCTDTQHICVGIDGELSGKKKEHKD